MSKPIGTEIAVALAALQGEITPAHKSGHNSYNDYDYSTLEDYYAVLRPLMAKHGIAIVFDTPEVRPSPDRKTLKNVTEYHVMVRIDGTIIHKSGEIIKISGWGEGQDVGDKAIYKAITGAKKYAISSAFAIPTTDDPECDSHEETRPESQQPQNPPGFKAPPLLAQSQQAKGPVRTVTAGKPATPPQAHAEAPSSPPAVTPAQDTPPKFPAGTGCLAKVKEATAQFFASKATGGKSLCGDFQLKNGLVTAAQYINIQTLLKSKKVDLVDFKMFLARAYFDVGPDQLEYEYVTLENIRVEWYQAIVKTITENGSLITAAAKGGKA